MKMLCRWCGLRRAVQKHHLVLRSRDRRLKTFDPNLVGLCIVCHDAAHRKKTYLDGFSCRVCPHFTTCEAGQATYTPIPETVPVIPPLES